MNVELLESVRQTIVFYPNRFCAAQWAFARNAERVLQDGARPEGFQACIAGHVLLEHGSHSERDLLREGGFHTGGALWERAADALGLGEDRCRELFFPSQWDKPYKQDYYLCSGDEEPNVAAAYLDYFMQKYGTPADVAAAREEPVNEFQNMPNKAVPVAQGETASV
jgi:hypothetical protein